MPKSALPRPQPRLVSSPSRARARRLASVISVEGCPTRGLTCARQCGGEKNSISEESGGEIGEICLIYCLNRVRAHHPASAGRRNLPEMPEFTKFTVNFATRLTLRTSRPQNGHFTPLYTTFLHFTLDSYSRYPLLSHVQYWDNAYGCADDLLRASLVAMLPRQGARPPRPLQHPRGLPRWDDYVSEGGAKRRTATVNFSS
jgi:hypothetical protein